MVSMLKGALKEKEVSDVDFTGEETNPAVRGCAPGLVRCGTTLIGLGC